MTSARALGLTGLSALAAGCQLAPAKVWNLEQLHAPEGTPKRTGVLHSDFGYLLSNLFRNSHFGGERGQAERETPKAIEDPLGECLENVIELGECARDERVAGLQAASFGWLAVDCTYLLSRERCALELGELARDLQLDQAPSWAGGEPASPEAVKVVFDRLVDVLREVVAAPGLAGDALERACDEARALPLDRPGALRLLRAANALLADGERGAVYAPLRALRLELARHVTTLALRAALDDPQGRVRAAALEANLRAFPAERPELLRHAIVDPMPEVEDRSLVSLRALEFVARYGLPPTPAETTPEAFRRDWEDLLVQVLRLSVDGQHNNAACRALAKLSGEPATLRPEVWMARWRRMREESPAGAMPAPVVPDPNRTDSAADPAAAPAGSG